MRRYRQVIEGEEVIHYEGNESDYSLCGLTLEGDTTINVQDAVLTDKEATCDGCLDLVEYVMNHFKESQ